ncbi:MAG: hypothetical protein JST11_12600 [Acidobacteria bacterium]|nr:hypothetical protein [Acidobacteriota bacterium]
MPGKREIKAPAREAVAPSTDPVWLRPVVAALAALLLAGLFSPPIADSDFWWHLRTGQYIAQHHALPVPDPFAWTTARVAAAHPAEAFTRRFNLTHEWLAQLAMYGVWRLGGFAGLAAARALLLLAVCALTGLICARRAGSFYLGVAGALAAGAVLAPFALDRPFLVTFLFLALTLAAIEYRRLLWALPALFLAWANAHGGYVMGFAVLGAYCAESLWFRRRDTTLWLAAAACVAVAAVNPNGLGIFRTLVEYRGSFMQGRLLEWSRPSLWPPAPFSVLLFAAALLMALNRRKVRPADWLLLAAFGAAAVAAQRNTAFLGLVAPPCIAGAWPWRRPLPALARTLAPAALTAGVIALAASGGYFQFRAGEWKYPKGAADFLAAHRVTAPLFNTYEHGGYLIWRLAPRERVFIDGRALSDALFQDYARILYNHDDNDGLPGGEQLLDRYGVEVIVMNTFEPSSGAVYVLAPALADPSQKTWKLVYNDPQAVVFMRTPPPGVTPLNSLDVLSHMETECSLHLENEPEYPRCARSLGDVFLKIGDTERARRWLARYLQLAREPDPAAEQALARLIGGVRPAAR